MQPLRIAQISDFHFTHITWNPCSLFSKRLLGNVNWLLARKNSFSREPLEALLPLLESLQVDRILIGGDFTTTSLASEFELAASFVQRLPAPWIAVPGNHDRYTYRACREGHFYRYFTNRKERERPVDTFSLSEHRIEAHQLASKWWAIALDTSHATNLHLSTGLFSTKQEAHLRELLGLIPADHSLLLLNHYPFFDNGSPQHALKRGEALESLVQGDSRIKAYLHGHTHRHTIANLQASRLPVVLDSGSAACQKQGSWHLLTLDEETLMVDVYQWDRKWALARKEVIAWTR